MCPRMANRILSYFWRGCLVLAPVVGTLYIGWLLISTVDRLIPIGIPGLGLVVTVGIVTLVGFLTSNVVGKAVVRSMENALTRVPLLKLLYTSIRDLINAFVGDKKRFDRPVAVAFTESARALGFVTRETLHGLHLPGHVAVYFPQSYNFAGNLLIVPKELVEPLDVHPTDMMAFIVSGGVSGLGIGSHGESMPPSMPPDRPTDQKTLIGHQGPGER